MSESTWDHAQVNERWVQLLCEDAAGNNFTEGERLIGLTLHGETFTFGMNNISALYAAKERELAGTRQISGMTHD